MGSDERKKLRKKSQVDGDVVVTCREGPAARKNGTRDGGRYERKEKLLVERQDRRWFVTEEVGAGALISVEKQRSGKCQWKSHLVRIKRIPPSLSRYIPSSVRDAPPAYGTSTEPFQISMASDAFGRRRVPGIIRELSTRIGRASRRGHETVGALCGSGAGY